MKSVFWKVQKCLFLIINSDKEKGIDKKKLCLTVPNEATPVNLLLLILLLFQREECRLRVFENRPHNEELHSLYRTPNIVRVIKSRKLRWAMHVARMEEARSALK